MLQRLQIQPTPCERTQPGFSRSSIVIACVEDVAIIALFLGHECRRGGRRVDDRQVGQAGRDGRDVMAPRTVASLAADGAVGRLGTDPIRPPRANVTWHCRHLTAPSRWAIIWPGYASVRAGVIVSRSDRVQPQPSQRAVVGHPHDPD